MLSGTEDEAGTTESESRSEAELDDKKSQSRTEDEAEKSSQKARSFSLAAVKKALSETDAFISTNTQGVHTLDAELLGQYFALTPAELAEQLDGIGLLKKNYSSSTLEEYERIGDKTVIVVRVKKGKLPLGGASSKPKTDIERDAPTPKKAAKKPTQKAASKTKTEKASGASKGNKLPESSTDNGLVLFAHRSKPGTLGFVINETVIKNELDGVIKQKKDSIEIGIQSLVDACISQGVSGHASIHANDVIDSILNYVTKNDVAHHIEIHPINGAVVTIPVKHIELVGLPNVIK
ncbi:hypothetical protein C9975_04750 [Thalassospira xiamenensis]|nr:hypothetical protein C9975_04750 [Thalassospira xiamenensis]